MYVEGKMRLVGSADAFHHGLRFSLVDSVEDLLIAEQRCIIGRLAGAHRRVGQPNDFLADDSQSAGYTNDEYEKPDRQRQPAMDQKPDF
ncbi:hypothetical protein D3C72_2144310 [compost metagenome]